MEVRGVEPLTYCMNESDDKLKMYKYYFILNTQAPPQLLLETSLNWETEFGTTKSAAIEVERTSSGIWKLRVGKDGTFNNLEELGTFSNTDFGTMNDDEGIVVLTDTLETRIDEVSYTDKQHYQLLASTEGVSLERVNPTLPPDKSSNWQSAAQTVGFATPVTKNSCFREFNATTSLLSIDPEIFSPNSDGYNDVAHIRFNLTEPGWSATVTVYNSRGREVCKLLNNALIDINADIVWNGLNNSNQQVSIGIYVIVAELFNLNGEYRKEKKAVVVAGKL